MAPPKLGLAVQAFVQVQMATHAPDKVKTFTRILSTRPEITSAWTLTGDFVRIADLEAPAILPPSSHNGKFPHHE